MTIMRRALVLLEVFIAAVFTLFQAQDWIMPLALALTLGGIAVAAVLPFRWELTTSTGASD
ncbi:hypothetical protein ACLQ2Q_15715 [Microbacterium sp. DT81.1]|uniref:hypothetical protein n=1 Tax=Microbacterium sp. DT81.1 TaxID=3393413 RepID=UPI003CE7B3CC